MKKYIYLLLGFGLLPLFSFSQDTLLFKSIPEIIFIEDKTEDERVFSPSQIEKIDSKKINYSAPSTSADLLQKTGAVMVQMSQSGGGSPIIRGFEANRVLLVVDGIRLNNAIYRSGHLQNSISISPLTLDRVDIIFGPSSVKYGSDALGGVIHYHTKSASVGEKWKGNVLQRYSSVNKGVNLYFDQRWGSKKWGFFQAINLNRFGNLKMGSNRLHEYDDWGAEEHIVDGKEQLQTAYDQADFIQKIRFNANQYLSFKMNLQLSTSTNINRFDQLNDITDGLPKYEEWYYGPQKRLLMGLGSEHQKKTLLYDSFNNTVSFQQIHESRNSKKPNASLIQRFEKVSVFSNTSDFIKKWGYKSLNYGLDLQHNSVESTASEGASTRYADGGSELSSLGIYSQYKHPFGKRSFFSGGLRYNISSLDAKFIEVQNYNFPFEEISLENSALTSCAGLFIGLKKGWEGRLSFATGFRSPNVDDVTKVFAKSGKLTVPNENLSPEFSNNYELGLSKRFGESYVSGTYYYTQLKDAIIKKQFSLNGQDSLMYDGELLPLYANTNSQEAYLFGYNLQAYLKINKKWSTTHSCSYTFGKDDSEGVLLDHMPPFYGKSQIDLNSPKTKSKTSIIVHYNAWKRAEDYSPNGSDNPEEATVDGTPSWWTLNLNYSVPLNDKIKAQLNIENILDVHYKTYSSGISAPGRNIILSLAAGF